MRRDDAPLVRCRQYFQTSSPLKPLGQWKPNFIWSLHRLREGMFTQMVMFTCSRTRLHVNSSIIPVNQGLNCNGKKKNQIIDGEQVRYTKVVCDSNKWGNYFGTRSK